MYTGTPGVFVKLYTLTDHDLSETVSLSYNINGLNLNSPRTYGVGWNVDVGGQVSREVRGLPDDFYGTGSDMRRGWLYHGSRPNNFPNSSDQSTSTCDEQADFNFINGVSYLLDSEPDLFSFSVGGISGHFVFDNTGALSLIPYQDIQITPSYTGTSITGWTIKTNDGITYTFNVLCPASRALTKQGNQNSVTILNRDFNLYSIDGSNPVVSYNAAWMLGTTVSYTGASLTYTYTTVSGGSAGWKVFSILDASGIAARTSLFLMMEYTSSTLKQIASIATSGSKMSVAFNGNKEISFFDIDRSYTDSFKKFSLAYTNGFLTSITESDNSLCTQMPPYKFYYNNMWNYPAVGSTSQDFWGFYNGASNSLTSYTPTIYVYPNEAGNERYRIYQIPGYSGTEVILPGTGNRTPNPDAMLTGSLSRVVYPTGGETDLVFEPQQYYDVKAGKDQLGGGLRIKSATYYDGVNPAANIVKTFSYVDASGHSSGKMIDMPVFAIPTWQFKNSTNTTISYSTLSSQGTAKLWSGITAVSQEDLNPTESTSGSTVGYTRVKVSRPGGGSAVFDYNVPAAYGDAATGVGSTDWKPTLMKFARTSVGCSSSSMNEVVGAETWGYPAFASPYYDYERGLLTKKWEYNETGTLVRTTENTYQYLFGPGMQPTLVTSLAYDIFANGTSYLFGRYQLVTNVAKVMATEVVKTYDENNAAKFSTEVTGYTFGSTYHRLVSRIDRTTNDGTVYGTSFRYTLDYPVDDNTQPTDSTLWMIWLLKKQNRTAEKIEQVSTILPSGGAEKVTGASLAVFRPFNYNKPLLRYQMAFRPAAPVTDFTPSASDGVNSFSNDPRYEIVSTVHEYDAFELPVSATGEDRNTSGTLWSYGARLPVASFSQARSISIGFTDFEAVTTATFTEANSYYGTGRTGAKGIHPYATLTRSGLIKPASASKYVLSFWAMPPLPQTTPQTMTLAITLNYGGSDHTTNYTFSFNQSVNDYQYFTQVIDVSAVSSPFTLKVAGYNITQPPYSVGSMIPSLTPLIDDVGFYPDFASIASTTYDIPFGASSVTSPSGITVFTTYDGLGRTKLQIDQNHNIRKRMTYAADGQILPTTIIAAVESIQGKYETGSPITFVARALNCLSGETYEWAIGNDPFGSPTTDNTFTPNYNPTPPATPPPYYTTPGNYTVRLRVSHPTYGSKTTTFDFTVYAPLSVTACPTGVQQMDNMVVTQTYSCYTNPNPANWITVKAQIGDFQGAITYQWQEHRIGTSTWTDVSNNNTATYGRLVLWREGSFEIKCTVTTSDGRTASTSPVLVTVNSN
ncbi:hypothetical protein WSM22_47020 [Cytophagales bacterium WSM2-2]|nr:hypothetical protein WSM22_47020 [Cytophagales bacterium WSM2-2]